MTKAQSYARGYCDGEEEMLNRCKEELAELVESFIRAGSGCEMGCSPDFVRSHFKLEE